MEVYEIPVDERYPDCVFVEDPVVVCDNTALITITGDNVIINEYLYYANLIVLSPFVVSKGHESRQGEAVAMEEMMKRLGLKVVKMTDPGLMDGGDVLFTGREFFVGLSTRTNKVRIT